MAIITVGTPFNIDLEFKIAAFGKRVLAWSVDVIIICIYFFLMLKFIYPLLDMDENIRTAAGYLILVIPVMIYQFSFEIFLNGQTLGKKITGIKIIDKEGNEPTWGQFIIRWMFCLGNLTIYSMPFYMMQSVFFIFGFMIFYVPDVITMLISPKSQKIGDLAAGTVVIDARYKANIAETIYKEVEVINYKPMFPEVMRLTDRDINGIRNMLDIKRTGRDADLYTMQVVDKIKFVLKIQTDMYGYDFLQQLLHDYNFLASGQ